MIINVTAGKDITMREAAFLYALKSIAETMKVRGWLKVIVE